MLEGFSIMLYSALSAPADPRLGGRRSGVGQLRSPRGPPLLNGVAYGSHFTQDEAVASGEIAPDRVLPAQTTN